MAGVEQMKKKLLPLLNMDSSLAPGMSIDASASYKVSGSLCGCFAILYHSARFDPDYYFCGGEVWMDFFYHVLVSCTLFCDRAMCNISQFRSLFIFSCRSSAPCGKFSFRRRGHIAESKVASSSSCLILVIFKDLVSQLHR